MTAEDLEEALAKAAALAEGLDIKEKARALHAALDETAARKKYRLQLRKPT